MPAGFLPSLKVPHPKLPVGKMVVSKFNKEPTICKVAYAWKQAFN